MRSGGQRSLFSGVIRLVPYSGVQVLRVSIAADLVEHTVAQFVEEIFDAGGSPQRVLLPLDSRASAATDAQPPVDPKGIDPKSGRVRSSKSVTLHPVTAKALDPEQVLTISGQAAVANFAGHWLPIPYLRFVGRDADGQPQFDVGPTNWARAYVAPAAAGAAEIVLAFDTALDALSRMDKTAYHAPNADDAAFGSTFVCAETVDDVSSLLSEPWIDTWLAGIGPASDKKTSHRSAPFQLSRVAHYLTLLRLLASSGQMPEVRFIDTVSRRYPVRTTTMDLIVDMGEAECSALLVDVTDDVAGDAAAGGYAETLVRRDLDDPLATYTGPFPTSVEFTAAPFGDAGVSRASGRGDAFLWPSLVRIGDEARRLSLRANAAEGVTGLSNLRASLLDDAQNPGVWRLSTDDVAPAQGPMVSGEMLELVSEGGSVLGHSSADGTTTDRSPAIRPRFSRASLTTFFLSEVFLHALTQANGASREGRSTHENEVREIRQIIVLAPQTSTPEEQSALQARMDEALTFVWRSFGWEQTPLAGHPKRPKTAVGLGGDMGTQIAFLHNEVATKYQGQFADLLRVYRGGDSNGGEAERLRVASIDVGLRVTTCMVVDYVASDGAIPGSEWAPDVQAAERLPTGVEGAQQAMIWSLVLPAIEAKLNRAGLNPARDFLDNITGRSTTSLIVEDPYFTRRFNRKVLWPAARALFALDAFGAASLANGNRSIELATLVAVGGGRLNDVAAAFDVAALQAGARGFALADTQIELNRGEIARLIRREMHDTLEQISRVVCQLGCDLLLASGDGMQLPAVRDELFTVLPLPASRIFDLTIYRNQTAAEAMGSLALPPAAALLPSLATALDRRHLLEGSGLVRHPLRHPALAAPVGQKPGQRALTGPTQDQAPAPLAWPAGARPAVRPAKGG